MLRVAIVGVGMMGGTHLNIYESMKDIEVVAVVDVEVEKAKAKINGKKIKVYSDIDDMLMNETMDFVDICTPSYLHMEHALKAINKGKHVICEKPMALTSKDAEQMAVCAEKNSVIYMTANVIRFWPEYMFLKKVYTEETYGKLLNGFFARIGTKPLWSWQNWMLDEKKSGGLLSDLHIHETDYIYFLLGKSLSLSVNSSKVECENLSYISTTYQYKDAFVTSEAAWFDCSYPFIASYRVLFEKALVEYKYGALYVYEKNKQPIQIVADNNILKNSEVNISTAGAYYNEIDYFINCIKTGKKPSIVTPEQSIDCMKILENIKSKTK